VWGEVFFPIVWPLLPEEPSVVGCTICGNSFVATHGRQIICSAECRAKASARGVARSRLASDKAVGGGRQAKASARGVARSRAKRKRNPL